MCSIKLPSEIKFNTNRTLRSRACDVPFRSGSDHHARNPDVRCQRNASLLAGKSAEDFYPSFGMDVMASGLVRPHDSTRDARKVYEPRHKALVSIHRFQFIHLSQITKELIGCVMYHPGDNESSKGSRQMSPPFLRPSLLKASGIIHETVTERSKRVIYMLPRSIILMYPPLFFSCQNTLIYDEYIYRRGELDLMIYGS